MPLPVAQLKKARDMLAVSKHLCVLTGAGISAESGLKTFRDAGGLWEDHPVEKVATPRGFAEDPEGVWRFYNARRKAADIAVPNAAHIALARMERGFSRKGKKKASAPTSHGNGNGSGMHHHDLAPMTILTQNIDGLHQQAGSREIIELHGSIWQVRCTQCGRISSDFPIALPVLPYCDACKGLLRPHVVWFGERLDEDVVADAEAAVKGCDLFLVVGTSAVVQPAAAYPFSAAARKIPVIEINMETTAVSAVAMLSLRGKAGEILPKVVPH